MPTPWPGHKSDSLYRADIDGLRAVSVLLVLGLTATALAPHRAPWRILPFTDSSAQHLSTALRRLVGIGVAVDFLYEALTQGGQFQAVSSVGALVLEDGVAEYED